MSAGGGRGYPSSDGSHQAYYQQQKLQQEQLHQQQKQQQQQQQQYGEHEGQGSRRGNYDHRDGAKSPARQSSSHGQHYSSKHGSSRSSHNGGRVRGQAGQAPAAAAYYNPVAPSTGQFRSGHIEVDTLYGMGGSAGSSNSQLVVNSMNAPNNSTMQCGCENIDCPFCNLMMSVQMKEGY